MVSGLTAKIEEKCRGDGDDCLGPLVPRKGGDAKERKVFDGIELCED